MHHGLDESHQARDTASQLGAGNKIYSVSAEDIKNSFPELIRTTEAPVLDLSCVALMKQAKSVSSDGFRVVLSGEGADEWLAGYPWHKLSRFLSFTIPTLLSLEGDGTQGLLNKTILALIGCNSRSQNLSSTRIKSMIDNVGGVNGWVLAHAFVASSVLRFFNRDLKEYLESKDPYADIFAGTRHQFDGLGMLDRELLVSFKIQLAGMLLSSKGDRISMHSSLETRYPFLDNDLAEFLLTIPPDMKLRGFTGKYLLRKCASRWLPKTIAWRRKAMFRAPFSSLLLTGSSCYVDQLLSAESIAKSGYFDKIAVSEARKRIATNNLSRLNRLSLEIGLVSVISIQLWHQAFLDRSIAEI
jgi:asparagine synthase (glutamine-hydrolysing)